MVSEGILTLSLALGSTCKTIAAPLGYCVEIQTLECLKFFNSSPGSETPVWLPPAPIGFADMSENRNVAVCNLAGAPYAGLHNDAATVTTTSNQREPFSQQAKTVWYAFLDSHLTRERTSPEEKSQYKCWCTESTMEKGLSGQVAKKRSWVKGCFQVEDDHLFRKPNKPDAKRRGGHFTSRTL